MRASRECATARQLATTVEAADIPTETALSATVTFTNDGGSETTVVLRPRVNEHVLATEEVSVPAETTRERTLTSDELATRTEVVVTRNEQKIGSVPVRNDG